MLRPKLNKSISTKDFNDFYWLKKELIDFCREIGINTTGGKKEISYRVLHFLQTGEVINRIKRKRKSSNFDWNNEVLDLPGQPHIFYGIDHLPKHQYLCCLQLFKVYLMICLI